MVVALGLASCEAYEEQKIQAQPGETVVINESTSLRLDRLAEDSQSGMGSGYAWSTADGVFITTTSTDGGTPSKEETKVGGLSRSDGYVLKDTINCGEAFLDPVFSLAGDPVVTEFDGDSIGNKTVKVYNVSDGQVLTLEDLYRYLMVQSTLPTPNYQPTSSVTGVRYENGTDENSRIVWVEVTVDQTVNGTTAGTAFNQVYEIGYVQVKEAAVEPTDPPYKVVMKEFTIFRTYRPKTEHSIGEVYMAFEVIDSITGQKVDEFKSDNFAMQALKIGHYGAPSKGYIVGEARLVGEAPTAVTETYLPDNEEALAASDTTSSERFKVVVNCNSEDYYIHFPVRDKDDSEGGMPGGGQRYRFTAKITYTHESGWTQTWEFTMTTVVNVIGWQQRTPQVDRSNETVNDVDGERKLQYAGTYVVEFTTHAYMNGEEVVYDLDKNENKEEPNYGYYTLSSQVPAGHSTKPFHTTEMAVDCWTSYLP